MSAQRISVAICGGGPTGLLLSTLLSKFRVPNILFEKDHVYSSHPQAHFINLRSMEIFRHYLNGMDNEIYLKSPPRSQWSDFVVCSSVLGREIARVDNFLSDPLKGRSPTSVCHLSQNRLIPLLLKEARNSATSSGYSGAESIRLGHKVVDINLTGEKRLTVQNLTTGNQEEIICDYIVGADGAHSLIRTCSGSKPGDPGELLGMPGLGSMMNVQFSCPSLSAHFLDNNVSRPGMLYFVYHPNVICVIVAHNAALDQWTCQIPFFPPFESAEMFTKDRALGLIQHAIGVSEGVTVVSIRPWTMGAQVVRSYQPSKGVFLAGDAAHQFPPAGGFGMNVGLQDALNLSWKLAQVYNDQADQSLLDSYEHERRPVATRCAALSVHNLRRSLRVAKALGIDPDVPAKLASLAKLAPNQELFDATNYIMQSALSLGRQHLSCLQDKTNPYGNRLAIQVHQVLKSGCGLPLLFPNDDIGYVYISKHENFRLKNKENIQSITVGARLPHFPLALSTVDSNCSLLSSVDLPAQMALSRATSKVFSGPQYVLLSFGESKKWKDILNDAFREIRLTTTIAVCAILPSIEPNFKPHIRCTNFILLSELLAEKEYDGSSLTLVDITNEMTDAMNQAKCSAILVRPDGHVAALFSNIATYANNISMLKSAFSMLGVTTSIPQ